MERTATLLAYPKIVADAEQFPSQLAEALRDMMRGPKHSPGVSTEGTKEAGSPALKKPENS